MSGDAAAREIVRRVEAALEAVERIPEVHREPALDALQALLVLYGAAFERVLTRLAEPDSTITPIALAADELIGHLLLVHGLHPLGFRELEEVPGAPGGPTLVQLDPGHGFRSGR